MTRFLRPLGITPYRLAKGIGVHVRRVSELIKGKRALTPDTAIRLGLYFDVPPRWWLRLQVRFDTEGSPRVAELRQVVKPYERLAEVLVTPNGVRRLQRTASERKQVETTKVPDGLLKVLRAQARMSGPRAEREVQAVVYEDGTRALVGKEA
jgi:addiction module HigA family antidote